MSMELRLNETTFESSEDGTMTVSGYVNKAGQLSQILGSAKRFVEKVAPGAFRKAIEQSQRDIDFLAEHKNELILSSTRNGSLKLIEDEQGLYMSAVITPTSWGKDYYELISNGLYRNMSFGFRTLKDSWKPLKDGLFERTIEELELMEVSVVKDPAYLQSTIAARGINLVEDVDIPSDLERENFNLEEFDKAMSELNKASEELRNFGTLLKEQVSKIAESTDQGTATVSLNEDEIRKIAKTVFLELREEMKEDQDEEDEKEKQDKKDSEDSEKDEEDSDKEKEEDRDEDSDEDEESDEDDKKKKKESEEDSDEEQKDSDEEEEDEEDRSKADISDLEKELRNQILSLQQKRGN